MNKHMLITARTGRTQGLVLREFAKKSGITIQTIAGRLLDEAIQQLTDGRLRADVSLLSAPHEEPQATTLNLVEFERNGECWLAIDDNVPDAAMQLETLIHLLNGAPPLIPRTRLAALAVIAARHGIKTVICTAAESTTNKEPV